jgi:hypothetical protein
LSVRVPCRHGELRWWSSVAWLALQRTLETKRLYKKASYRSDRLAWLLQQP